MEEELPGCVEWQLIFCRGVVLRAAGVNDLSQLSYLRVV